MGAKTSGFPPTGGPGGGPGLRDGASGEPADPGGVTPGMDRGSGRGDLARAGPWDGMRDGVGGGGLRRVRLQRSSPSRAFDREKTSGRGHLGGAASPRGK